MKTLSRILLCIVFAALTFTIPVQAKTIKHNMAETTLTIAPKDKISLKIPGVKVKNVVWKSKNKSIAKVNKSGIVTGLKKGKTKITAKCYDITFTVNVTVQINAKSIDKTYNKLVYKDQYLSIYLYKNKKGNIIMKYYLDYIEDYLYLHIDHIEVNGEMYEPYNDMVILNSKMDTIESLDLSELGQSDYYEYPFTNEKVKVCSYYYTYTDEGNKTILVNYEFKL